jgi:hypothetical protein
VKIRFIADANFKQRIVLGVLRRQPKVDFLWGGLVDLTGLPDRDVLALGAAEGRVVVTHDIRTFPSIFGEFVLATESAGVILVPQHLPFGIAIQSLVRVWEEFQPDDWKNRIVRVPL